VGINGQGTGGEALAAQGEARRGKEAGEVMAVAHQQHAAEGRQVVRRTLQPGREGGELAGGILAATVDVEGPATSASALGGCGLAGEGAAEEEQGAARLRQGRIQPVIAVKHHHQRGAGSGCHRWAEEGPEEPEGQGGEPRKEADAPGKTRADGARAHQNGRSRFR